MQNGKEYKADERGEAVAIDPIFQSRSTVFELRHRETPERIARRRYMQLPRIPTELCLQKQRSNLDQYSSLSKIHPNLFFRTIFQSSNNSNV